MALDPTARRANVQDSMKKYFVDNFETTEGIALRFDRTIAAPTLQGHEVDKWLSIIFGAMDRK